jgi:hypothetical protein
MLQPEVRDALRDSLHTVQNEIRSGVIPSHARAVDNHRERWVTFCHSHYLNPFRFNLTDPFLIFQVFTTCYRSGEIAPRGQPIRAGTVDGGLCAVGQRFAHMGALAYVRQPLAT